MTLRITAVLPLSILLAVATVAQTNQSLNDQLWEAARAMRRPLDDFAMNLIAHQT